MRITIGGLKGGIGKTTTAAFLATALARTGPTLAIDADPQSQSLYDWHEIATKERGQVMPWECIPWATDDLARKVRGIADRYAHVIIDTGGGTERLFRAACAVAPELVVPVRPNLIELRRVPATFRAAAEVRDLAGVDMYPHVLLVAVDSRTGDGPAGREFLAAGVPNDDGELIPLPAMAAQVRQSVLYSRAFGWVPDDLGDYGDVFAELVAEVPA